MGNNNRNLTKKEDQVMELKVNQEVKEAEGVTEIVDPEETTVVDAPAKKTLREAFKDAKAKHPRATKVARKIVTIVALIGAGMLGKSVGEKLQEQKDADLLQGAIDNGDLIRANDEMLAEANEMLDESTDI